MPRPLLRPSDLEAVIDLLASIRSEASYAVRYRHGEDAHVLRRSLDNIMRLTAHLEVKP